MPVPAMSKLIAWPNNNAFKTPGGKDATKRDNGLHALLSGLLLEQHTLALGVTAT